MCLIFDRFNNRDDAEKFAATVTEIFKRKTAVYDSQAESEGRNATNPEQLFDEFPFKLNAPIVLVDNFVEALETQAHEHRTLLELRNCAECVAKLEIEHQIESTVQQFGGVFAGT
jgi:hypothetical protein